jgi:ribosomal protein L11 methyltransferase
MALSAAVWRLVVEVPAGAVGAFVRVVETACDTVSWTEPEARGPEKRCTVRIEGYSETEPDEAMISTMLAVAASSQNVPAPLLYLACLGPRDWVAENRAGFPPIGVGRYFIHGTHYEGVAPPGRIRLVVDAGAAFGSGEHASTAGCLRALDGLAKRRRFRAPLDMGCGSGILAMAMARTWRVGVRAADIDPDAIRVAAANARLNAVAPLVRVAASNGYHSSMVREGAPYDLIVANILARPLCRMAGDLARHLETGGVAVLAGLLSRDAGRVQAAHRAHGLKLVKYIPMGDWRTLILSRGPANR